MKLGSLCTGILGLDCAVAEHFGADLVWYSEIDAAPISVIEREHPSRPNLGDLKQIEWADVPPVDVLTAGYPCQPFSAAGKRKGKDDPRHLWPYIAEAVRVLRPRWVVLENVAGHLTLGFGDVLRDLAEAGFDAEWCLLRASDVGAPHGRARLFISATDPAPARQGDPRRLLAAGLPTDPDASPGDRRPPTTADSRGERHGRGQDGGAVGSVDVGDASEAREWERARAVAVDRGAPAPSDADLRRREQRESDQRGLPLADQDGARVRWGDYEPAIRRWGAVLGRPAPDPTDDGKLSPAFVEWMMGYPSGWVDGLTRSQALKALGNAVVPQQALAALRELAPVLEQAA